MERIAEKTEVEELNSCVAQFLARYGMGDGGLLPAAEPVGDADAKQDDTTANTADTMQQIDETLRKAIEQIELEIEANPDSSPTVADLRNLAATVSDVETQATDQTALNSNRVSTSLTRETLCQLRSVANSISTNVLTRHQFKLRLNQVMKSVLWSVTAAGTSVTLTALSPRTDNLTFWLSAVALTQAAFALVWAQFQLVSLKRAAR